MNPTPTPYEVRHSKLLETNVVLRPNGARPGRAVCRVFHLEHAQRLVDAEFIATACNNHDALVAVVRGMLAEADRNTDPFIAARKLLKDLDK